MIATATTWSPKYAKYEYYSSSTSTASNIVDYSEDWVVVAVPASGQQKPDEPDEPKAAPFEWPEEIPGEARRWRHSAKAGISQARPNAKKCRVARCRIREPPDAGVGRAVPGDFRPPGRFCWMFG